MGTREALMTTVSLLGVDFNLFAVGLIACFVVLLIAFWQVQVSKRLDFADMITKNGKTVSLTKVLQLVGGLTATWIMVVMTLSGSLTESILGIYLAYVGGIEGYSKYVAAKYNYSEQSVKDNKE